MTSLDLDEIIKNQPESQKKALKTVKNALEMIRSIRPTVSEEIIPPFSRRMVSTQRYGYGEIRLPISSEV